jgi:hypothetical protein
MSTYAARLPTRLVAEIRRRGKPWLQGLIERGLLEQRGQSQDRERAELAISEP